MKDNRFDPHPTAEALHALLDGALPPGELRVVEEHLASCARCAAELDGWRALFEELSGLPPVAPSPGFADAVMEGVRVPAPLPLAARLRGWLGGGAPAGHPDAERLQDYLDGALPARHAARVRTHLGSCPACAGEAEGWRTALAALERLDHLAPREDFADAVMARVRVPAPAPRRVPEWRRALAGVGRLLPQTRQAWATVAGVAVSPVATLGLVLWTLFTHPTLTPGALASFAFWKASAWAGVAWEALSAAALESAGLFKVYSLFGSMGASPAILAGGFLALSVGSVVASWVLYRNLFTHHPVDGRVAHAPLS